MHWKFTLDTPLDVETKKRLNEFDAHIQKVFRWTCETPFFSPDAEDGENPTEWRGFCKVAGNELNAYTILYSLHYIQNRILPLRIKAKITLNDEGEFLYHQVILEDSARIRPDLEDLKKEIGAWALVTLGFGNQSYRDCAESILSQRLEVMRHFEEIQGRHLKELHPLSEGNENIFWNIQDLHRPIKKEDFENFPEWGNGKDGGVMAGFHGEYFGLVEKGTDEKKSAEMFSRIFEIFCDVEDLTIAVQPTDKKERGISTKSKVLPREK